MYKKKLFFKYSIISNLQILIDTIDCNYINDYNVSYVELFK